MADDPMTIESSQAINVAPGLRTVQFVMSGPADYDSTNGSALDLSDYFTTQIWNVVFSAVDAAADALVIPTYVNDDMTDLDGGAVYFTWNPAAAASSAAVFANVDNTTNLSGYKWMVTVSGY
jgi:hypothetical protein